MLIVKKISLLTLIILISIMLTFGSSGDYIAYKFQFYNDNNDVEVFSNTVKVNKTIGEHVKLDIGYLVDAISGASRKDKKSEKIDGVTSASQGDITEDSLDGMTSASEGDEKRHEVKGGVTFTFDPGKIFNKEKENDDPLFISINGIHSKEYDYTSKTLGFSVSQDLFQRNTTISGSYYKSFDHFDPPGGWYNSIANEMNDVGWNLLGTGRRETQNVSFNVTQGITIYTVASVIFGLKLDEGYLGRPYYTYEIGNDNWYHEVLPSKRNCKTLTGKVNQYIPLLKGTSIHADYRFYWDSWEMISHTLGLKIYLRFFERFITVPSYRFYTQNSAFFYKDTYTISDINNYKTTDFKYRESNTHTLGIKFIYELRDFFKPEDAPFLSLFPVNFDVAINYMRRTGSKDPAVIESHYNYWDPDEGYHNFWIQAGAKFVF